MQLPAQMLSFPILDYRIASWLGKEPKGYCPMLEALEQGSLATDKGRKDQGLFDNLPLLITGAIVCEFGRFLVILKGFIEPG
jgi:hypothetical protein